MDIFWNHTITIIDAIAGIQMLRSAYILNGYLSSHFSLFSAHDHPETDQ